MAFGCPPSTLAVEFCYSLFIYIYMHISRVSPVAFFFAGLSQSRDVAPPAARVHELAPRLIYIICEYIYTYIYIYMYIYIYLHTFTYICIHNKRAGHVASEYIYD